MGLDMYLTGVRTFKAHGIPRGDKRGEMIDLGYWRKHPNLHGYIVREFAGGEDRCQEIHLYADDLRQIIAAVEAQELPETTGFFFGVSDGTEKEGDRLIFQEAVTWLEQDDPEAWRAVVYRASW